MPSLCISLGWFNSRDALLPRRHFAQGCTVDEWPLSKRKMCMVKIKMPRTHGRGVNPGWSPVARAAPPFNASQAIGKLESTVTDTSLSHGATAKASLQTTSWKSSLLRHGWTRPVLHLSPFWAFCGVRF